MERADGPRRCGRRAAVVVVLALGLLATGCGSASDHGAESAPAVPPATVDADTSHSRTTGAAQDAADSGLTLAPGSGSTPAAILALEPVIPPPEVAEEVLAAAQQAVSESELSLQDCTAWIANPSISLEHAQAQECSTMLAAAVESCEELECFAAPPGAAPTTTFPPDEAPAASPATTSAAAVTTTARPATAAPTTTAAAEEPEPTPTTAGPTTTQASTTTASPEAAEPTPEGGHPPLPLAGMIPRNEPYWGYPICTGSPPWPSNCYPPSEWEVAQDLSHCTLSPYPDAGVGGICASKRPDRPPHEEIPRQTQDVVDFMSWCGASWHPLSCGYVLFGMKWSLDYLGAHPWCVLQQYYNRIAAHDDSWNRGTSPPADIADRHGWHLCPTVIDPGLDDDPLQRLSETGITLADQCRMVLPADVQLEDRPDRATIEAQRFGSDCDAWAEWVENRPKARNWRDCDRSARLAEEWMEHHHNTPERYFIVTC